MTTPVAVAPRIDVKPLAQARTGGGRRLKLRSQIGLQLVCLAIGSTVLFPIVWIVGMSIDPRNISRPDSLIPPGANLDAYLRVLQRPTLNPVSFFQLALNSLSVAVLISALSVGLGGSLLGVALAVTSTQLPFAIWNMKGYLDTIPKELEEAAVVDGAGKFQTFLRIVLPLSTPVLAVTALFGFIAGWTEFLLAQVFIVGDPSQW